MFALCERQWLHSEDLHLHMKVIVISSLLNLMSGAEQKLFNRVFNRDQSGIRSTQ